MQIIKGFFSNKEWLIIALLLLTVGFLLISIKIFGYESNLLKYMGE
jgi:hypothetical protein